MSAVADHTTARPPAAPAGVETGERAARRALRGQIARLERDLAAAVAEAFPRVAIDARVASFGGPRLLGLAELEQIRDELAGRLQDARRVLAERADAEAASRRLIEEMLVEPERHTWVRVSNADIGERGCKHWHVRPRWGLLGMLLGWWRVKLSSGCPLPWGSRPPGRRPATDLLSPPLPDHVGRRSRQRAAAADPRRGSASPAPPPTAPKPARPARRRPGHGEPPPAPWGSFPLAELSVFLALVLGILGFVIWGREGKILVVCAAALGSLAGLELSIREHLAGFRSHSTVLAGTITVIALAVMFFAKLPQIAMLPVGAAIFAAAFFALREVFRRRSGGLGFR